MKNIVRSLVVVLVVIGFGALLSIGPSPLPAVHAACGNPGLYCNTSQVISFTASTQIITDTTNLTLPVNAYLGQFNSVTPKLALMILAIISLGFGVTLLRRFARPKAVR